MQRRVLAPLLLVGLAACSADDDLIGRWRSPEGSELEFFEDGTMNFGKTASMGARFRVTDAGLQIEQQLLGPVTLPLEMMGDSFRVDGKGVLGGERMTFYRDTGGKPPVSYGLVGEPSARGTCSEEHKNFLSRLDVLTGERTPPIKKQVPIEAAFIAGDLMLDPLTHAFTQTIALELRAGEGPDGAMLGGPKLTGTYRGRFKESDDIVELIYQDAGSLTHVTGRRNGDKVVLPAAEFFRVLKAGEGQGMSWDLHRAGDTHHPVWGDLPDLTFQADEG